jgi:hypothetical protein
VVKARVGSMLVAMMLGLSARAQTPDPVPPVGPPGYQASTLKVTTRIVVLDVVVTDKQGKLVDRPLTKDDFTIFEDRVPQTIRSFETPSDHTMPTVVAGQAVVNSAADLKKIGDAPVTVLVLDELNSKFEDMSYSRQMMIKYLQEQPRVLNQPTVLMIAMNTSFQQVHDYTQDRDALIDVVKHHMPEYLWRMMNGGGGGPAAVERTAQVLAALQQIAQASNGTAGRKNLIWVGNGYPSLHGADARCADHDVHHQPDGRLELDHRCGRSGRSGPGKRGGCGPVRIGDGDVLEPGLRDRRDRIPGAKRPEQRHRRGCREG